MKEQDEGLLLDNTSLFTHRLKKFQRLCSPSSRLFHTCFSLCFLLLIWFNSTPIICCHLLVISLNPTAFAMLFLPFCLVPPPSFYHLVSSARTAGRITGCECTNRLKWLYIVPCLREKNDLMRILPLLFCWPLCLMVFISFSKE